MAMEELYERGITHGKMWLGYWKWHYVHLYAVEFVKDSTFLEMKDNWLVAAKFWIHFKKKTNVSP